MKKIILIIVMLMVVFLFAIDLLACSGCGCRAKKSAKSPKRIKRTPKPEFSVSNISKPDREIKKISKAGVQKLIEKQKDLVIIDVLSPKSYAKGHIKGAINIPLNKLHKDFVINSLDRNKTYVVYCANKRCKASSKAVEMLSNHGFKKVFEYKNGIAEWRESKLPVATAKLCGCGAAKGSPICCK